MFYVKVSYNVYLSIPCNIFYYQRRIIYELLDTYCNVQVHHGLEKACCQNNETEFGIRVAQKPVHEYITPCFPTSISLRATQSTARLHRRHLHCQVFHPNLAEPRFEP